MNAAEVVGATLGGLGADRVFGVVGSGNFHVTNALVAAGARFVATRHEAGAAIAADAYARVSGRPGIVTVHQGCGLTNAMTGIAEAAKSRTPMIVLAAEATAPRSNFRVDQDALAVAVGATSRRVRSAETAVEDTAGAWHLAVAERRTVVLNLPLEVQAAPALPSQPPRFERPRPPIPDVAELAALLAEADRPVFIAGRGALHARAGGRLARLDGWLNRRGLSAVLLVRFLPLAPFGLIGYAYGTTSVCRKRYLLGTTLASIPSAISYAVIGAAVTKPHEMSPLTLAPALIGFTLTTAIVVRWKRAARRSQA